MFFIIPAHNEEDYLVKTIESLRLSILQSEIIAKSEIIVVDNDSMDLTADDWQKFGVTVTKEPMPDCQSKKFGCLACKG